MAQIRGMQIYFILQVWSSHMTHVPWQCCTLQRSAALSNFVLKDNFKYSWFVEVYLVIAYNRKTVITVVAVYQFFAPLWWRVCGRIRGCALSERIQASVRASVCVYCVSSIKKQLAVGWIGNSVLTHAFTAYFSLGF